VLGLFAWAQGLAISSSFLPRAMAGTIGTSPAAFLL
jgi:hypothetical protein